ncbi:MAG: hypothetical protein U9Q73_01115 [Nanoarchaeota archaeon]|nr:hypothetical protein [Nanoarchaeota archaeon]
MKIISIIVICLMCSGCSVVAPGISKAQTEEKQLKELVKQTRALERIAEAIEAANK